VLSEISNTFLLVYAALFPIVNPIGSAPVFLSLTRHYDPATRHRLAARVALNGFLLLLGSLFVGSHILDFFGITLPIVRIAGGCVVSAMAWQLLREGSAAAEQKGMPAAEEAAPDPLQQAFYPLTMPLTVGPGSISVAITLGSQRPHGAATLADLALVGTGAVAGLVAIAATIYFSYRYAERLVAALGESGTNVLIRLSAFVLLCIGIEIIWGGYSTLASLPK